MNTKQKLILVTIAELIVNAAFYAGGYEHGKRDAEKIKILVEKEDHKIAKY